VEDTKGNGLDLAKELGKKATRKLCEMGCLDLGRKTPFKLQAAAKVSLGTV